jgi:hypothetical protein
VTVRHYSNLARPVALGADVGSTDTVWPVATTAGYPAPPFTLGVERGTVNEEMALCTAMDSVSFTVTRGFDSTPNVGHTAGAAIEHVTGAIDYAEANSHVNDSLKHFTVCTTTTRPASPPIGQSIYETDTHMPMRYIGSSTWTTDHVLERWWTYVADNLSATGWTTFFNSGNLAASSGWPGAGFTPSGLINYPHLMEVRVLGRFGFSVEPGNTWLAIDSPEGTGIWQPGGASGVVDNRVDHNGWFYPVVSVGWKLSWTPAVPSFVLRYLVAPPGENTYLRLAIQARIVPLF